LLLHSLRGSCVMKDSQGDPRGVSRRGFLTGTGAAAAAVAGLTAELAPPAAAQPPTGAPALGPAPVVLELTVNGKKVVTKVEPRVTLLDAPRNHLDVAATTSTSPAASASATAAPAGRARSRSTGAPSTRARRSPSRPAGRTSRRPSRSASAGLTPFRQ